MAIVTQTRAGEILDALETDPEWGGFGYLGERRNVRQAVADGDYPAAMLDRMAEVDTLLIRVLGAGVQLFRFVDSREGRHFADWAFSTDQPPAEAVSRWNHRWGGKLYRQGVRW